MEGLADRGFLWLNVARFQHRVPKRIVGMRKDFDFNNRHVIDKNLLETMSDWLSRIECETWFAVKIAKASGLLKKNC